VGTGVESMAADGPQAMRRAGHYSLLTPKPGKPYQTEFETGARAAEKDPGKMPVLVEQYAVVGDQSDAQSAMGAMAEMV
jgi:hypothetical protein